MIFCGCSGSRCEKVTQDVPERSLRSVQVNRTKTTASPPRATNLRKRLSSRARNAASISNFPVEAAGMWRRAQIAVAS